MKFCSKCGKEIHDEAVICVHCGCSVGGSQNKKPTKTDNADNAEYNRLMAFVNEAKTIHVLGIISIVLCLGIGIIFQIINMVKIKKFVVQGQKELNFPEFNLTDRNDIMLYESAKNKIKLANTLTIIGYVISVILITFIIVMAIMGEI